MIKTKGVLTHINTQFFYNAEREGLNKIHFLQSVIVIRDTVCLDLINSPLITVNHDNTS